MAERGRGVPADAGGTEGTTGRPASAGIVLVVDDEPAVRDSIVRLLRARRFRAIGAVDGRDALRRAFAESARLDLVVTEASLPDMTGVELVARLRAARPETRIVLTTADPEIAAQAPERLGVDGVLVKPFPASDAVALVERLLGEGATGATEPGEESVDS